MTTGGLALARRPVAHTLLGGTNPGETILIEVIEEGRRDGMDTIRMLDLLVHAKGLRRLESAKFRRPGVEECARLYDPVDMRSLARE